MYVCMYYRLRDCRRLSYGRIEILRLGDGLKAVRKIEIRTYMYVHTKTDQIRILKMYELLCICCICFVAAFLFACINERCQSFFFVSSRIKYDFIFIIWKLNSVEKLSERCEKKVAYYFFCSHTYQTIFSMNSSAVIIEMPRLTYIHMYICRQIKICM